MILRPANRIRDGVAVWAEGNIRWVGEFQPEHVGKTQFYLAALDDLARLPDENPSIGIILRKSRDRTIVEYALRESNKLIGVARYCLVSTLPAELRAQLLASEEIVNLLKEAKGGGVAAPFGVTAPPLSARSLRPDSGGFQIA